MNSHRDAPGWGRAQGLGGNGAPAQNNRSTDIDRLARSVSIADLLPSGNTYRKKATSNGGELAGPCPVCGGRDRFIYWPNADRPGWFCRQCGKGGDVFALVMHMHGVGFREALNILGGCGAERPLVRQVRPKRDRDDAAHVAARTRQAAAIWRGAEPADGTLVERYLRGRGLALPIPASLRFARSARHKPSGHYLPAMIGLVQSVNGDLTAVHRTYLAPDGLGKAQVDPVKMMLAPVRGGAVRLAEAAPALVVAEGIETALAVQQATGTPTWATLSASGIQCLILPPLPMASAITICADPDSTGLSAANAAAARWHSEGRSVRIARPPDGADFLDVLNAEGVAS